MAIKTPSDPDNGTMFALFYSLLLSLERRGILKQQDFIDDLGEAIALAETEKFLAPAYTKRLSQFRSWLENQNSRIQEK
jgi:hypothetical protein